MAHCLITGKISYSGTLVTIFLVNNIEILGTKKINKNELLQNLKLFYDQNILLIRKNDIQKIIEKYELIKEFNIKKVYPDKLKIEIYESEIVGFVIKNKKKYFLTDHKKLLLTDNFDLIVGGYAQQYPFHYYQKDFCTDKLIERYEHRVFQST